MHNPRQNLSCSSDMWWIDMTHTRALWISSYYVMLGHFPENHQLCSRWSQMTCTENVHSKLRSSNLISIHKAFCKCLSDASMDSHLNTTWSQIITWSVLIITQKVVLLVIVYAAQVGMITGLQLHQALWSSTQCWASALSPCNSPLQED